MERGERHLNGVFLRSAFSKNNRHFDSNFDGLSEKSVTVKDSKAIGCLISAKWGWHWCSNMANGENLSNDIATDDFKMN